MKRRKITFISLIVLGILFLVALGTVIGVKAGWVDNPFSNEEESSTGSQGFLRVPDSGEEPVFSMPLDDGTPAEIRFDTYTGVPSWVTGPIPAPAAATRQESAVKYFETNKAIYQMAAPAEELAVGQVETDATGTTHVSINQTYNGVPVFGSDLKVHFSADGKNITAVNGRYYPGIDIDVTPAITAEDAVAAARASLEIESATVPENEPAQLVVLTPVGKEVALTWKVVLAAEAPVLREIYFIDASDGSISYQFNDVKTAAPIAVFDAQQSDQSKGPAAGNDDTANDTRINVEKAYNYFLTTHSRSSFDNKGGKIITLVHFKDKDSGVNNAFGWAGWLMFGDNTPPNKPFGLGLDVVAHEYTHGITDYEANLLYEGQSGALNESFSDVFGVMVDRDDWLIGEDIQVNRKSCQKGSGPPAARSLENPSDYCQPDHMNKYSKPWFMPCGKSNDNCFVHKNSGIPNKAAYNVAQAIGKEKMEAIWYRALTVYLTNTSQFDDARSASEQAARDLYGNGSGELAAVSNGFEAVGIGGAGPVNASARIEVDHKDPTKKSKYLKRDRLVVTVGVGDTNHPRWSKKLDNEQLQVREGIYASIDISEGEKYLDPSTDNTWFLKVEDKERDGAEGSIRRFTILHGGNEFQATNLPVDVKDDQTSIVYIPTPASGPTPTPVEIGGQSDTVLVMDVSGSMSDPAGSSGKTKMEAAKAGATNILNMVRDENLVQGGTHRLGLVSFTDTATIEQSLGGQYSAMESAVSAMSPQSGTNLGEGLQSGLNAMTGVTSARERIIIILSDGMSNTGMSNDEILNGPVAFAKKQGIKIFTVGFGSGGSSDMYGGIDEEFLKQIASQTGGEYYYAEEYFDLENVYIRLRQQSRGEVVANLSGTATDSSQDAGVFDVKIENGELHGTVNWEEGQTDIVLVDPDGREVDSEYPGAYIFNESKPAYVVVKNPQPGTWKARVKSAEGTGGAYDVVVSAQEGTYRLEDYPWALALTGGASLLLMLGVYGIFRRPIRVS